MSYTNEQLLEAFGSMTVMELVELTRALEEKFGVKASDVITPMVPQVNTAPVVEEQTEFSVVLSEVGEKRIQVIKILREVTGASLMDAGKNTVPGAVIKDGLAKAEAEALKTRFEEVGAKIELR
jgi:large subunit ribosomal protein L7/L12